MRDFRRRNRQFILQSDASVGAVTAYKEDRLLEWEGRLANVPGVLTGRHRLEVIPLSDHQCDFIQSEQFSGILVPFFDLRDTRIQFERMNSALKERAEANQ